MANIYFPTSSLILQRNTISSSYIETVINVLPNVVFFFDTGSQLQSMSQSVFALTASWAQNSINGGTTLFTASTYPITTSWANNSQSSSYYALVASDVFMFQVFS